LIVTIHPSKLNAQIAAPVSKSSMQRACAAALLHKGTTIIENPGHSNDDLAALDVIVQLGAVIRDKNQHRIVVNSRGVHPVASSIHCGESGLGLRMFSPLVALHDKPVTVNGSGSLLTRPMDFFDKVFPLLGVDIQSNNGKLPLTIKGPLHPANIEIDGSLSSQFLTGLLMAYAVKDATGTSIHVRNLKSRPYIDLTLEVMKHFGWIVTHHAYETFHFTKPQLQQEEIRYKVEGDWSGASFLLVAGAICGPVTLEGLNTDSAQADKEILRALRAAGAGLTISDGLITVVPSTLNAFTFDATDCPDLFPPLVALATYCTGNTVIRGTTRLTHKESNRALTLQEEFGKMGVVIQIDGDTMIIQGGSKILTGAVHSRHDHRIAMACAIAALKAKSPVSIEAAEAVDKSYPDFYKDLEQAGVTVTYN
jgi:3-phosphoshikimate 1-carboxyvinyltransferase